jgi:hypothetical protein
VKRNAYVVFGYPPLPEVAGVIAELGELMVEEAQIPKAGAQLDALRDSPAIHNVSV